MENSPGFFLQQKLMTSWDFNGIPRKKTLRNHGIFGASSLGGGLNVETCCDWQTGMMGMSWGCVARYDVRYWGDILRIRSGAKNPNGLSGFRWIVTPTSPSQRSGVISHLRDSWDEPPSSPSFSTIKCRIESLLLKTWQFTWNRDEHGLKQWSIWFGKIKT